MRRGGRLVLGNSDAALTFMGVLCLYRCGLLIRSVAVHLDSGGFLEIDSVEPKPNEFQNFCRHS